MTTELSMRDRYALLNHEQKRVVTALFDQNLLDCADEIVTRLRRVVKESRNDAAAVAAAKTLVSLLEKRGLMKADSFSDFATDLLLEQRAGNSYEYADP